MVQKSGNMKGTLYLIPSTLGENSPASIIPQSNINVIGKLDHFIVEDLKTARRFLKKVIPFIVIDRLTFHLLNEHTRQDEIPFLLEPLLKGSDMGLISEAGLPCVADPGSALVGYAHDQEVKVAPLSGPSSLFLALMASGFNGQKFAFSGYLPIDKRERATKIRELESLVYQHDQTQIFIETPYRNRQMMDALMEACKPETKICVAVDLTLPGEMIRTRSVQQWKRMKSTDFHKKPAVFLLYR
jgi:16S rRNA (cytidine1402-2'-O)-methyltransferase